MKRKPPLKPIPREKIQKKVNTIRKLMAFGAKEMVDMKHAHGKDTWFDTEVGKVRALTYGFESSKVKPLLIDIHGGGFVLGTAAMDDPFMMQFVDQCGVKVIGIDYTLSPDAMFPTALNECYAVIKYAKTHAKELKIDPDKIVIMGHSAGGNFCAAIGLMENEKPELGLKGIILDYPPTDIATDPYDKPMPKGCLDPDTCRMYNAAYCKPEEATNPLVSPAFATEEMVKNFPPTLVITASLDSLAEETEQLKDTMLRAGVDVTFRRFEDVTHGFTVVGEKHAKRQPKDYAASLEAWPMMVDFVNKVLGQPEAREELRSFKRPKFPAPKFHRLFEIEEAEGTNYQVSANYTVKTVAEGKVRGDFLQGTLRHGGGRWERKVPSGLTVDSKYTIETADGAIILMHADGWRDNRGERLHIHFETGAKNYAWLNHTIAVGRVEDSKLAVYGMLPTDAPAKAAESAALEIEKLYYVEVHVEEQMKSGKFRGGELLVIPIESGAFVGEKLNGKVECLGADYNILKQGMPVESHITTRYMLTTDDGANIALATDGRMYMDMNGVKAMMKQDADAVEKCYFRQHLMFNTGHPRYSWINDEICFAVIAMGKDGVVRYEAYMLK